MIYESNYQNREKLRSINVSACYYKAERARGYPLHCHSFYELDYSILGERIAFLKGKKITLPEGSLFFVPLLNSHATNNIAPYTENVIIQFSWEFLYVNAKTMTRRTNIMPDGELLEKGYIIPELGGPLEKCLESLYQVSPIHCVTDLDVEERITEFNNKHIKTSGLDNAKFALNHTPYTEWKNNALTMQLITLLLEARHLKITENLGDAMDVANIQPILEILITQPETKLSLQEAAKIACMSYCNFSRRFKQLTGYNYVDYCNIMRIQHAEGLLISTELSVTEISQRLNFGCINYFNRVFRKFNGNTPMQYRKKHRLKNSSDSSDLDPFQQNKIIS